MKISSWNVNSIRARLDNIKNYIEISEPDILFLQEIKPEEKNFPFYFFKDLKFECHLNGQKAYNGVSILSKKKLINIETNIVKDNLNQARYISSDIKFGKNLIKLVNVYVPNGNPINTSKYDYKLNWLSNFTKLIEKIKKNYEFLIIGGDFNIIPEDIDVHDPNRYKNDALFLPEVREYYKKFIQMGLIDIFREKHPNTIEYSFWDYFANSFKRNNGMRIDHFFITEAIRKKVKSISINKKPRSKIKPSDHTPIELIIT